MHHDYLPWSLGWTCKYKASQMLRWTMFPHVSHINKHHRRDTIRIHVGFIISYEYHPAGSNKPPPLRWHPGSWSVPFENETAMPRGEPEAKPGTPSMAEMAGFSDCNWFQVVLYAWLWVNQLCLGLPSVEIQPELVRVHEIANGNNYHSIWRSVLLFILIEHSPSNTKQ